MLRPFWILCVAAMAGATTATAQPVPSTGGPQRPVFSPYLNLLNGGGGPALNYFGLVVPQQQFQQQAGMLQQQIRNANQDLQSVQAQNRQLVGGIIDALLPSTGNVATFNNTGNYFNRIGGGAGGATFGGGNRAGGGLGGVQPSFARPAGGALGAGGAMGGGGMNRPRGQMPGGINR